jgi:(5-formylfuran-3-yl)methyl phosphate synthase
MSRLLASVSTVEEALSVLEGGADIIDLKNPQQGALGALPLSLVRDIVRAVVRRRPLSATVGDLPMIPQMLMQAVAEMASTGVDIVKVGFFGHEYHAECIRALQPLAAQGVNIVAVLFADAEPDLDMLPLLSKAGMHGVMLDTAKKDGKSLRHHLADAQLESFVEQARSLGLLTGLAGSLSMEDIPDLVRMQPDYLGFRGALCSESDRHSVLEPQRMMNLRDMLYSCNTTLKEFA